MKAKKIHFIRFLLPVLFTATICQAQIFQPNSCSSYVIQNCNSSTTICQANVSTAATSTAGQYASTLLQSGKSFLLSKNPPQKLSDGRISVAGTGTDGQDLKLLSFSNGRGKSIYCSGNISTQVNEAPTCNPGQGTVGSGQQGDCTTAQSASTSADTLNINSCIDDSGNSVSSPLPGNSCAVAGYGASSGANAFNSFNPDNSSVNGLSTGGSGAGGSSNSGSATGN